MKLGIRVNQWVRQFSKYRYILCGVVLCIGVIGFISYRTALDRITLKVDGTVCEWQTINATVADVLREKQVDLKPGDVVKPGLKTPVTEDLEIEVIRAFPVTLKVAGVIKTYNTIAQPVKDVLAQAGVAYGPDDKVRPALDTIVQPEQTIRVIKVTSEIITRTIVTEPATEYYRDKSLKRGTQKVVRTGKSGRIERQIKIVYEDGREINRSKIAERVIQPAVKSLVAVGLPVLRTLVTNRGSYQYVEVRTMTATAYYPGPESCGKYAVNGVTYTGKKAGFGIVAVDPRVIPLGTKVYVEGYGKAEAADIGGAIKGNKIDLCFETFREAALYGVKKIKVYILE
ncbi:MAG TPA: 3D domain-containing protein [Bacillota bacterium]